MIKKNKIYLISKKNIWSDKLNKMLTDLGKHINDDIH